MKPYKTFPSTLRLMTWLVKFMAQPLSNDILLSTQILSVVSFCLAGRYSIRTKKIESVLEELIAAKSNRNEQLSH